MDLNDITKNPEQLKQFIALLQGLLPKDDKYDPPEKNEEEFVSPVRTKNPKRDPKKQRPNKFLDMPEKDMHKDDSVIDKLLTKHPPVARSREFEPISVKCRICGKTEEINPALISDSPTRYKCNNCSTSAG
jgi:hypothetical protein